jgi:hypothetical protein
MIVLLVCAANILTVKEGTSIRPACLPALSAPLAYLQRYCFVEVDFCYIICFEQSTFLRYLWFQAVFKQQSCDFGLTR